MAAFAKDTHVTPPERAAFQAFLDDGYVDVVRPHTPGPEVYTYWDYYRQRFERNRGMRIDFVLGSPSLADRVTGAFIDRDERAGTGASDHAPVVVDLIVPCGGRCCPGGRTAERAPGRRDVDPLGRACWPARAVGVVFVAPRLRGSCSTATSRSTRTAASRFADGVPPYVERREPGRTAGPPRPGRRRAGPPARSAATTCSACGC